MNDREKLLKIIDANKNPMIFTIEKVTVTAKSRQLKEEYTVDIDQHLYDWCEEEYDKEIEDEYRETESFELH